VKYPTMSSNDKNRVTILLPLNDSRFLVETLRSINQQSVRGDLANLLVVIDGPMQKTDIQRILDSHITELPWRVIKTENTGIVGALNTGIKYSDTEFIARIDQDDLMVKNRIEIQLNFLRENPKVVCVGGQLELIDEFGFNIGFSFFPKSQWLISKTIELASPMAHPAVMFRRLEVVAVGGYRKNCPEDWDLWLRLHETGKISNVSEILVKYRVHQNQLSRTNLYNIETARQLVRISRILRENGNIDLPHANQTIASWIQENRELLVNPKVVDSLKIKLWVYVWKVNSLMLRAKQIIDGESSDRA
jgi:glycosyltransferase involved in cell wall biosynthesis